MAGPIATAANPDKKNPAISIYCEACRNNCCRNPRLTPVLLPSEERMFKRQSASINTPFREMFVIKKEGGKCVFLDAAAMRCTAYQKRPLECRLYPFLLDFTAGTNVKLDKRFCPNLGSLIFDKKCITSFVKQHDFPADWIKGYETLIDF